MTEDVRIRIVAASDEDASLWRLTSEVARLLGSLPWVLVGGQMVAVLEAEHGVKIGFATGDVDAVLDVRAEAGVTLEAARRLLDAGFEPDPAGARGHRFIRGEAMVDVLAPDNVGSRADLRTVPPDRAVEVTGGSQALARARVVVVVAEDEAFRLPIPNVAGAIVLKSRVATVATTDREKHQRDLARLLALVPDVVALRDELTVRERGYLRDHLALLDVQHPAWRNVDGAEDGAAALAYLISNIDAR